MRNLALSKNNTEKTLTELRVSRRHFIKNALALGILSTTSGVLLSCDDDTPALLSPSQEKRLISVQNILFPKDENGPGAYDVNAHEYVKWWLADTHIDPDEQRYLRNGLKWVEDTALETHQTPFLDLTKQAQVDLIYQIAGESWGESWLSVMLTYIFEALISDPIYGFNQNGIGWTWLNHQSGLPRPTEALKYDTIFKTIQTTPHNG